jgi:soluble lytic murein transglycosylase-like protein
MWVRLQRTTIGAGATLALCAITALSPRPARAEPWSAADARTTVPAALEQVHAHVAGRLPRLDAAARSALARTITAEATRARLDPLVVLALIQIESSFNPLAASSAGARGLMQLREPTMRGEALRSGVSSADPHDPVANVQAGVRYLRRLMDAFGSFDVALMAYNAGPNRILGHLRAGGIPERFHVYPRKVRAELQRLRRAYGLEPRPALAAIGVDEARRATSGLRPIAGARLAILGSRPAPSRAGAAHRGGASAWLELAAVARPGEPADERRHKIALPPVVAVAIDDRALVRGRRSRAATAALPPPA